MSAPDLALRQESNLPEEGGGKEQEMKSVPEVNALPDDYPWANFGLRPPVMKEIQIIRRTQIRGVPFNVGDVTKVTEQDALTMIACGVATSYPPPETKEETPEELAAIQKWTDYAAEVQEKHKGTLYSFATILPCGGSPSSSAPLRRSSRGTARANALSFIRLITDDASRSRTLLDGRTSEAATMKPLSSSQANSVRSRRDSRGTPL